MTAPFATLAIFSTHILFLPLCGVIAVWLGDKELMPGLFAGLFVAAMYLPEHARHEETVK